MASILVVDDEEDMLRTIAYNLERAGHEVTCASSGAAALERLAEHTPDLIISDVMMPGMDGLAFCAAVRTRSASALTPFLFVTAKGQPADKYAGLRAGADDYVTKPFDLADLLARVNGRLEHRKRIAAVEQRLAAARDRWARSDALPEMALAREEHARLAAQVEARERDRRLHDELHRAYSDLRTDLNFQLRPEVSEIASSFITELTDARYTELELDDKYRLVVLEDGVPQPVISGGEEDVANLVLRLAISQMIADRAGQAFSLLVLDEVFGSLDEVRRQHVLTLLRGLHDRFEQVIVITHIEGVRDGLDRVITVGFDERTGGAVVGAPAAAPGDAPLLQAGSAA